ncbi:TonB-dependent receptor [Ferruginibacter paludis]|uniref:TonB-dependent receptor n=1 Tax=Ferruginibacter paludis TaxID=1310417 RepID=UPI0025B5451E|nr:TonB-dependent receptor [Ferruginibacter paludis]MDN3656780.1 TonB-dependent receptor [Ferruginibacter paludis]
MFYQIPVSNRLSGGTRSLCLLVVSTILFAHMVVAQTGKLTGKIIDAANNEAIMSANITVKETRYGKSTLADGTYTLNLPAGTYTVSFSHAGYTAKELTGVIIKEGQPTVLDVILQTVSNKLAGVVITSSVKKEAQSSLYSAQKRSAAASDGISTEAIRKTPDNNAGQILKRVVGLNVQDNRFVVVRGLNDQYNQTMLNGVPMTSTETNRNAFAFDLIPAAVIDNITVNKTATPDMPGNFAGGIVQVNTKDFPVKDFYSVTVQTGFSDQTFGKDFYADKRNKLAVIGFQEKSLLLPKEFPTGTSQVPIYFLNPQERSRYLKTLANNLAPVNDGHSGLNESFQLGWGKSFKLKNDNQIGIVAAISQRKTELIERETTSRDPIFSNGLLPDTISGLGYYSQNMRYRYSVDIGGVVNLAYRFGNSKITLKNLYSQVLNNLFIDRPEVRFGNTDFFNQDNQYIGLTYLNEKKSILNSILSGEHRTGKNNETRLEWNVNATANNTTTPDTRNFVFGIKDSVQRIVEQGSSNLTYSAALSGASRAWSENKDIIYGGAFNITTPFNFSGNKHLFKAGILFQNRQRKATGTVLPVENTISATIDSIFAASSYAPGSTDVTNRLAASASTSSNYNAGSSLLAAYESVENKIGKKIRIIWGVRIENYQQTISVYTPLYLRDFQEPLQQTAQFGARSVVNILPSVNFIYSPVQSVNIRAAYSNTVIRPELKDLASFVRYDYQNFSLTQGNQFLKSASITNYDVKLEWFPTSGEIVTVAGFYKNLKDPIEYAKGRTGFDVDKFRIPVNAGNAYVKGVEAEVRKRLDFISFAKWLNHVTLFGNGTLLQSQVKRKVINDFYFDYVGEHALSGQANYILNAGASLQLFSNSFEATISLNRTGDYNNELGSSDFTRTLANGHLVAALPPYRMKARNMVDLVFTQALWKEKCKIKMQVTNLLNKPYILYQDINGNGKADEPVIINIRKSFDNYLQGTDNYASQVAGQRTYSLAITYTF